MIDVNKISDQDPSRSPAACLHHFGLILGTFGPELFAITLFRVVAMFAHIGEEGTLEEALNNIKRNFDDFKEKPEVVESGLSIIHQAEEIAKAMIPQIREAAAEMMAKQSKLH